MGREARVNQDLEIINTRLGDYFGKDVVSGLPIHRVIHAKGITEKRKITRCDVYTEGGIFLREEINKVMEVLKYPDYQDYYVFEMFIPMPKIENEQADEIIPEDSVNYSYECFYVFRDKDWNPLPVNWRACEVIMHFKLYGKREKSTGQSEDIDKANEDAKQIKYFEDKLAEDSLVTDPNYGVRGMFVPSNYEKRRYGSGLLMDKTPLRVDNSKPVVAGV